MKKTIRFNSSIQALEKVNPLFSRATIRVLYEGFNRNGSHISKQVAEDAIASIYNIPIVGEYIEHADNFGSHGISAEIKGDDVQLVSSTKPYGVIPESAKIYWEDVTESDGTVNSYLVVDGAYLWSGRYEEINNLLERQFGQSMEIEIVNGSFAVLDGVETFKIDEFIFSALCILGVDKNGEGHVEPVFESANITAYSLDKESFKQQFKQMIEELNFTTQGGDNMTEKVKKDYEKTEVEFENEEVKEGDKQTTETVDETQVENKEDVVADDSHSETDSELTTVEEGDTEVDNEENTTQEEFALTARQLQEQLRNALGKYTYEDRWGDTCRKYWYVDNTDSEVIYEDVQDDYQLYGATYTLIGDNVEIQLDKAYKVKVEFVPFEGGSTEFTANLERFEKLLSQTVDVVHEADKELEENFETLSAEHKSLKVQLSKLESYKRQREESDLKTKFEGQLSEEELKQLFEKNKEVDLEKLEQEMYALIGKKNFSLSSTKAEKSNKISIASPKEEEHNPYGDIFN